MPTGSASWQGQAERADERLGRRVLAAMVVVAVIVAYVVHDALPVTHFSLPLTSNHSYARTVAPQSWAFFTKSPRTPPVTVFERGSDGWRDRSPGRLAVPADLMGLNRVRQAEQLIVYDLRAQVPAEAWSDCDREPTDCLAGLPTAATIANHSTSRTICGDVGLIVREVPPWAWRDLPTIMPSRVVRAKVIC
ncbi:SdpA family antimicrobial peptide system protein [Plantactinospora sp. KBS50]|uniref:SdpA family antimicrobial peptide system protein n=1 Tax=Plantactinospora sp. KBS50 TaxID=2024580 RepID=UPI0012FE0F70|nr:SdpA family antimicrobial peptide system protein [Plantactinospora sp. KBS50]